VVIFATGTKFKVHFSYIDVFKKLSNIIAFSSTSRPIIPAVLFSKSSSPSIPNAPLEIGLSTLNFVEPVNAYPDFL